MNKLIKRFAAITVACSLTGVNVLEAKDLKNGFNDDNKEITDEYFEGFDKSENILI